MLTPAEAEAMIRLYVGGDHSGAAGDGLQPFTPESVVEVLRFARGNIRRFLELSPRVSTRPSPKMALSITPDVVAQTIRKTTS